MTFSAKETVVEEGGQKGGVIGGAIGGVIDATEALTKRQKAEALSINESAVGKHITAIKNKGFLVRQGDTRGYWEINLDKN